MNGGLYRPCPTCKTNTIRREIPEWARQTPLGMEVPRWYAYECPGCGSVMFLQPFANIKQVVKG